MKVNGRAYRTIWLNADGSSVDVIDQRWLPHEFRVATLRTVGEAATAIRDMWVRGAPLIGVTAAYGVALAMREDSERRESRRRLGNGCMRRGRRRSTCAGRSTPCATVSARSTRDARRRGLRAGRRDRRRGRRDQPRHRPQRPRRSSARSRRRRSRASRSTSSPIATPGWLATVDYGTATAPIYLAMEEGIPVHVYVDETRPRNQGASLTAWELVHHGTPHTLIVDNAGGHLMQHGLVDMVIVGTDRTTARGDVCNKIGTYLKALAAKDNGVPFYVALPSPTIDWTVDDGVKEIPIEERSADEVDFIQGLGADGKVARVRISPARKPRRQPRLRRDAGAARDRADHRARGRGGLARGAEGAVSGARLAGRQKIVLD